MVNVRFGNMSVTEFEEHVGVRFSEDDRDFLEKHRSDIARPDRSQYHIFKEPLAIVVGEDICRQLVDILTKYSADYERNFSVLEANND